MSGIAGWREIDLTYVGEEIVQSFGAARQFMTQGVCRGEWPAVLVSTRSASNVPVTCHSKGLPLLPDGQRTGARSS